MALVTMECSGHYSLALASHLRAAQAKVCQRLVRLVELGELFDDPTCRTARQVLRIAPTAKAATRRRASTLANANAGLGRRRLDQAKAKRLPGRGRRLDRGARA